ncbi:MAG: flagellar hook-associated protein 3 FlgL [Candidatus Atribacteria bacterium]|nr:flagellar hook-associated protein 3 FlgL [Candidatus Atribacteria bacterium]
MRVTQKILTDRSMQNLNNILSRVLRTQDMLTSGKAISRPSDDPVRFNQVLSLRTSIEKLDQYTSNVEDGINWLNLVDESLDSVSGVLGKVRTLVLQGANGTLTAEDREIIATEIEAYLEELIGTANTSYAGRQLFSGTQTLTVSFSREEGVISYNGDNNSIILEIESGTTVAIGFPGDDVFFRGFEASSDVINSINVGDSFTINGETVTIDSTSLSDLVNSINNNLNLKSEVYALSDGGRLILRSRTADPLVLADVTGTPLQNWGIIGSGGNILNSRETEGFFEALSGDMTSINFSGYNGHSFTINGETFIIGPGITDLTDLVDSINNFINSNANLNSKVLALSDGGRLILRSLTADPLVLTGTPLQNWGIIGSGGNILNSREAEGVFKVVEDIIKDLRNNDVAKLSGEDLENLDKALDNLLAVRSQVGARTLRLENSLNRFGEFSVNFKKLLSLNEDIDVAEVIMQLNEHQSVYQMALAATARVLQPTLLDFLQ